jgi:hypothetical protein
MHFLCEHFGPAAQGESKFDFEATARLSIEHRSDGHLCAEHFFQAECLCTELDEIAVGWLSLAALVFNRVGSGMELDDVGAP